MQTIDNDKAKRLLTNRIYDCTLNIMYENSMTKNYYISDNGIKLMIRFTTEGTITTLAVALFDIYNQDYMQCIKDIIDEACSNLDNMLSVQLYSDDILVDQFKNLNFKVNLILRDHIRVDNEFYTVLSLSRGGRLDVENFKHQEII